MTEEKMSGIQILYRIVYLVAYFFIMPIILIWYTFTLIIPDNPMLGCAYLGGVGILVGRNIYLVHQAVKEGLK